MFQFTHPGKGATGATLLLTAIPGAFQFTHPGKGATKVVSARYSLLEVSIHAPWEGCDVSLPKWRLLKFSFNSRTLGRVRRGS